MRSLFVSVAVIATYPSPDGNALVDIAAAFHAFPVAVLVRLFPFALTPTSDVHTTGSAGREYVELQFPDSTADVIVAPWSYKDVSTTSGYVGVSVLVYSARPLRRYLTSP